VPRTIAQINDPRDAWLFDEHFHVDVALNQSEILARLIAEEMSLGDMVTLLKLRRGQFSVVEEKVPPGAKAVGQAIRDMRVPDQCVIAAIIRRGEMVVPYGGTIFEEGDEVLAVTDGEGADWLAAQLAPPRRPREAGG
jgi:trk system potassium uptake protein TrkA